MNIHHRANNEDMTRHHLPLIALLYLSSSIVTANTISLKADIWYPFNGTPDAKKPGYMVEIAKQAWGESGYTVNYQLMDWDETLEQTASGKVDCAVGVAKKEAPNFIYPTEPLGMDDTAFYTLMNDEKWVYQSVNSLKNKRIGIVEDYSYDNGEIDTYILQHKASDPNIHVAKGDNPLANLIQLILDKKIDIILASPPVFRAKARRMGLDTLFKEAARLNNPFPVYIACSPKNKKSKEYTELLNNKVIEMRNNGQLKKLLSYYGIRDWK